MTGRIGLAVGQESVRAVAVREDVVTWSAERRLAADESLTDSVRALLGEVPVRRWLKPKVVAALGPARVQVKALRGLPQLADARDLARLVRENASRFFLSNGVPLMTTTGLVQPGGTVWAAAYDRPAVEALAEACSGSRFRLDAVMPSVLALGAGVEGNSVEWRDGLSAVRVEYAGRGLAGVTRLPPESVPDGAIRPVAALQRLGADSWRFADAFGAARLGAHVSMALRPEHAAGRNVPRARLAAAAGALCLALAAAVLTPGVAWRRAAAAAEAVLAAQVDVYGDAAAAEAELARVTAALAEFGDFGASRQSRLLLLEELAAALPSPGAVVALRLEDTEGEIVFLVPDGVTPLAWLERVPSVSNAVIVGPITRESAGGTTLVRVAARFQQARSTTAASNGGPAT